MKKFFTIILFVLNTFLSPLAVVSAGADSTAQYACILSEDTYFYETEKSAGGLFVLPKTYYVKVLSIGDEFTKVEYQADTEHTQTLIGYCKTSQLTFVDYIPVNPYLYATFEVIYTAEDAEKDDDLLGKITFTCAYYGDYSIGSKQYAYVLREGEYAYVPKPLGFRYEENTEHAEWLSSQGESPLVDTTATPIQIGVLVVLCLLVPLLSAVIIKSSHAPTYDIED